jgi:hypothetical protein
MKLVLLLVLIFSSFIVNGQADSTNIYFQAILHYNNYLEEINSDDKEIFIEKNQEVTEMLPSQIGNRKIVLLTLANSTEHHKRNQNMIKYIKIYPGKIQDDKVDIRLMPYYSQYQGKKNGFAVAISDHLTIHFQFDCTTRRFKYLNTSGRMPLDLYKK